MHPFPLLLKHAQELRWSSSELNRRPACWFFAVALELRMKFDCDTDY